MQIEAHQKAVALFESYAAAGENEKLKEWANDTLPTLKEHLEHAQDLKTNVDQTAGMEDNKKNQTAQVEANQTPDEAKDSRSTADTVARNEVNAGTEADKPGSKSNIKYLKRQSPTDWTSEALVGRTVENGNGDNLGEINNVIINEKGNVVAAVIGVGGFLGIGEKNVAVPFDALEFRTVDPAEQRKADTRDEKSEERRDAAEARFDSEHDDMHIVLNTTKEDLEAAPEFAWLGEGNSDRAQDDQSAR
jgi:putative membrane protein